MQALPSTEASTATGAGKKCMRGPDKQPRKRRTQTQKGTRGKTVAETVAETKEAAAVQRGLEALREAAVDKDIENGDW